MWLEKYQFLFLCRCRWDWSILIWCSLVQFVEPCSDITAPVNWVPSLCYIRRCAVMCFVVCVTLESTTCEFMSCPSPPLCSLRLWTDNFPIYKGTLLASCYEVQAFLGEGSFGKVTKCANIVTDTEVAIKITKDEPIFTKQALEEVDQKLLIYQNWSWNMHLKMLCNYIYHITKTFSL